MQTQSTTPRRRGRPRKHPVNQQFPGVVIRFDSRPRLMVGDVVELCRDCRPCNHGKIGIIMGFDTDGTAFLHAMPGGYFHTFNERTGEATGVSVEATAAPENLYRRSSYLRMERRAPA